MAGNNNYPYFNNGLGSPVMQQPPMSQTQIQCFAVSSRDEANRIPIQIGVMYVIINKVEKEIYIKQWNNDGLIDMDVYKNEKSIPAQKPENDYSQMLTSINSKIEEIQKSLLKPEVNTNVP